MAVPPQFPHYRWRGLPRVVQQQLYRLGVGAACPQQCVLCGAGDHGCFLCPQRGTPNGRAMWEAWDRRWLLLQARELELYALSGSEGEYLRRSGAGFVPSPVTFLVVRLFRPQPPGRPQMRPAMRPARAPQRAPVGSPTSAPAPTPVPAPGPSAFRRVGKGTLQQAKPASLPQHELPKRAAGKP